MLIEIVIENEFCPFSSTANLHYEKFCDGTVKCIQKKIPFEIPDNWAWTRFRNIIVNDKGGGTPDKSNPKYWGGSIQWMSVKDFSGAKNGVIVDTIDHVTQEGVNNSSTNIIDTSAIILCTRMGLGKYAKLAHPTAINQDLRAIWLSKNIHENYFLAFYSTLNIDGNGTTVEGIKKEQLLNTLIPIPPFKEQARIANIQKTGFSEIEIIENQKIALCELINNTKSKILDLAIRGKLVSQDPNDEPASALLERIRHEKEELIKVGKLKRDKRESVIFRGEDNSYYETIGNKKACIDSEIHYDIPEGWTVERLKNLYSVNPKNDIANDETIVSFVPMNLINDQFLYNCTYELKQWKDCKKGFTHFADGDLGFAKISPCFENRKSVVFSNLKNGYGAGTTELYILRNFCEGLNPKYTILFLKSESFIERGVDTYSGTVGQQRIDKNIMMDTIIPIPPQNEQQRIADRVKQLFSILDSIQATIV